MQTGYLHAIVIRQTKTATHAIKVLRIVSILDAFLVTIE